MRKKYLWKKAIQKSCNATEGIDSSFANYLIKSYSVDVKVNLSRGTECGFFRSGFSYYKVEGQSEQATTLIAVVGDREVYKFGCYSFSWILTHFRLIKSIKVYKETESILNQDENDGDNESKKKE